MMNQMMSFEKVKMGEAQENGALGATITNT